MQPLALHKKCGKQMEQPQFIFPMKKQTKKNKKKHKRDDKKQETLHSRLVTEENNKHLPN